MLPMTSVMTSLMSSMGTAHTSSLIGWQHLVALVPSSFVKQAFLDLGDTAHLLVSLLSSCWTVLLWPLNIPLGWVFSLSCWDNWNKACLPRPTPVCEQACSDLVKGDSGQADALPWVSPWWPSSSSGPCPPLQLSSYPGSFHLCVPAPSVFFQFLLKI